MNPKDALRQTLSMGPMVTERYLADLTAPDLLIRPVEGQNHIAWQLGHLLLSERHMLESIKPGSSPALPDNFEEGHGRDKTSVDDPSKYLAPADYLRLMTAQREATKRVLDGLSEAELDAPAAESFQRMAPTVGNVFNLIGCHELMHVGQYVPVRRQLGKPVAI